MSILNPSDILFNTIERLWVHSHEWKMVREALSGAGKFEGERFYYRPLPEPNAASLFSGNHWQASLLHGHRGFGEFSLDILYEYDKDKIDIYTSDKDAARLIKGAHLEFFEKYMLMSEKEKAFFESIEKEDITKTLYSALGREKNKSPYMPHAKHNGHIQDITGKMYFGIPVFDKQKK